MSTHAEEVARLKDAVVEAAKEVAAAYREVGPDGRIVLVTEALVRAVDAIIAAEALTCETCGGSGIRIRDMQNPKCPACHGTGRKPDKEEANG